MLSKATAALGAILVVALTSSGASATSMSIASGGRNGSILAVSGQASFTNQPPQLLGSDPAGDQLVPGTDTTGKDLVGFSMSTTVGGVISFRWHLSQLTPGTGRGVDVSYGKAFCTGPTDDPRCFVITFVDVFGSLNSYVWGWTCSDETCAIGAGDHTHSWETDSYDVAGKIASAGIPMSDLGIEPGSELRAASSVNWGSSVFVTTPWWFNSDLFGDPPTYDGTAIGGTYRVPAREVSLAIGPRGQTPADVTFTTPVTLEANDTFATGLDISGLAPGEYAIYGRACFGPGNCGYATRNVTL